MDFFIKLLTPKSDEEVWKDPAQRLNRFEREYQNLVQTYRKASHANRKASTASLEASTTSLKTHLGVITKILTEESRGPMPHVCIHYTAVKHVYAAVAKVAATSHNAVIVQDALAFFALLVDNDEESFVAKATFSEHLVYFVTCIANVSRKHLTKEIEVRVVELAFNIATKLRMNPRNLPAWFTPTTITAPPTAQTDPSSAVLPITAAEDGSSIDWKTHFPIFYFLVDYIHRDQKVGDFSRTGLLYIIELATRSPELEIWIVNSELATLMATGIGALYSRLSRKLVIDYPSQHLPPILAFSDYQHPVVTTTEIVASCSPVFRTQLKTFLSHLHFWQDALQRCESIEIRTTLLEHFQVLFLQQILYPSLLESSDIDGGSSVAVLTYLRRILDSLDHPDMIALILRYLLSLPEPQSSSSSPSPVDPTQSRSDDRPSGKKAVSALAQLREELWEEKERTTTTTDQDGQEKTDASDADVAVLTPLTPSQKMPDSPSVVHEANRPRPKLDGVAKAARRRKSERLSNMMAKSPTETVSSPLLFNLVDLILASLRSNSHQTIHATLLLVSTLVRNHHPYTTLTLLQTEPIADVSAGQKAGQHRRTIGAHEQEVEFLVSLLEASGVGEALTSSSTGPSTNTNSSSVFPSDSLSMASETTLPASGHPNQLSDMYGKILEDTQIRLECHACSRPLLVPKKAEDGLTNRDRLQKARAKQRKVSIDHDVKTPLLSAIVEPSTGVLGAQPTMHHHRVRPDDPLFTTLLDLLEPFFLNPVTTNLSVTEALMELALCGFVSLEGWMLRSPKSYEYDTDHESTVDQESQVDKCKTVDREAEANDDIDVDKETAEIEGEILEKMWAAEEKKEQELVRSIRQCHRRPKWNVETLPRFYHVLQTLCEELGWYRNHVPRFDELVQQRRAALSAADTTPPKQSAPSPSETVAASTTAGSATVSGSSIRSAKSSTSSTTLRPETPTSMSKKMTPTLTTSPPRPTSSSLLTSPSSLLSSSTALASQFFSSSSASSSSSPTAPTRKPSALAGLEDFTQRVFQEISSSVSSTLPTRSNSPKQTPAVVSSSSMMVVPPPRTSSRQHLQEHHKMQQQQEQLQKRSHEQEQEQRRRRRQEEHLQEQRAMQDQGHLLAFSLPMDHSRLPSRSPSPHPTPRQSVISPSDAVRPPAPGNFMNRQEDEDGGDDTDRDGTDTPVAPASDQDERESMFVTTSDQSILARRIGRAGGAAPVPRKPDVDSDGSDDTESEDSWDEASRRKSSIRPQKDTEASSDISGRVSADVKAEDDGGTAAPEKTKKDEVDGDRADRDGQDRDDDRAGQETSATEEDKHTGDRRRAKTESRRKTHSKERVEESRRNHSKERVEESRDETVTVSHLVTNAVLFQSFLMEWTALVQARAGILDDVRYV